MSLNKIQQQDPLSPMQSLCETKDVGRGKMKHRTKEGVMKCTEDKNNAHFPSHLQSSGSSGVTQEIKNKPQAAMLH